MDMNNATVGPRTALSALQSARDAEALAAYIGVCPTCLGWDDPEAEQSERTAEPGRAACPTCGLCSVEWDLTMAIEGQLSRLCGLAALDTAVRSEPLL